MKEIKITENIIFGGDALPLIAGPCVIESREHSIKMASAIKNIADRLAVPFSVYFLE